MDKDNIIIVPPELLQDTNLPNPELLNFFQDLEDRIIWIDDEINNYTLEIAKYIVRFNKEDKDLAIEDRKPIKLLFNSPGGELQVYQSLSDIIQLSKTPVWGIAIGEVASAAAYLFLTCHKRLMLRNSFFLFHKGSIEFAGGAEEIINLIADYKSQINQFSEKIGIFTKFTNEEIEKNLTSDWYVRSDLALEKGVVDQIIDDIDLLF